MQKLGVELMENTLLNPTKRWMFVKPKDSVGAVLLSAKVASDYQLGAIGNRRGAGFFFSCTPISLGVVDDQCSAATLSFS